VLYAMVSWGDQLDRGGTGGEDPVEAGGTGMLPSNGTCIIVSMSERMRK
jgi:hypothetical protein